MYVPDFISHIKTTDVLFLPGWCNFMDSNTVQEQILADIIFGDLLK